MTNSISGAGVSPFFLTPLLKQSQKPQKASSFEKTLSSDCFTPTETRLHSSTSQQNNTQLLATLREQNQQMKQIADTLNNSLQSSPDPTKLLQMKQELQKILSSIESASSINANESRLKPTSDKKPDSNSPHFGRRTRPAEGSGVLTNLQQAQQNLQRVLQLIHQNTNHLETMQTHLDQVSQGLPGTSREQKHHYKAIYQDSKRRTQSVKNNSRQEQSLLAQTQQDIGRIPRELRSDLQRQVFDLQPLLNTQRETAQNLMGLITFLGIRYAVSSYNSTPAA